jgi:hypothetical protein
VHSKAKLLWEQKPEPPSRDGSQERTAPCSTSTYDTQKSHSPCHWSVPHFRFSNVSNSSSRFKLPLSDTDSPWGLTPAFPLRHPACFNPFCPLPRWGERSGLSVSVQSNLHPTASVWALRGLVNLTGRRWSWEGWRVWSWCLRFLKPDSHLWLSF